MDNKLTSQVDFLNVHGNFVAISSKNLFGFHRKASKRKTKKKCSAKHTADSSVTSYRTLTGNMTLRKQVQGIFASTIESLLQLAYHPHPHC